MHFQTWSDKRGNAPPLTDPKDTSLVFEPQCASVWRGRLPDQPDHAGADDILEPEFARMFDRSSYGYNRGGNGRAKFLTDMGLFRPIATVLCTPTRPRRGRG